MRNLYLVGWAIIFCLSTNATAANFLDDNYSYTSNSFTENSLNDNCNITFSPMAMDVHCAEACDGSVWGFSGLTGGVEPYSWNWEGEGLQWDYPDKNWLCPGSYCVTVTDATGCSADACVTIGVATGNPAGFPCNDFNSCTENDMLDADCNCVGTFIDSDNDGICDANDDTPEMDCFNAPTNYPSASGSFPWHEWISRVYVADMDYSSAKEGYGNFTTTTAHVNAGATYEMDVSVTFSYSGYDEYLKVWIDYNQDGDFDDAGEEAISDLLSDPGNGAGTVIITNDLVIPTTAFYGGTRMRVAIQREAAPGPNDNFTYGEVEDYIICIAAPDGSGPTCDNVTNSGEIEYNNNGGSLCAGTDPGAISSVSLPSGGSGEIEYIWLASTNGCPTSSADAILGTNSATYNPGPLTQTTYFIRCSRRNGCIEYPGESNCVVIEVDVCNDPVILSIDDVVVNEADGVATLTLSINEALSSDLEVFYSTTNSTAIAGSDYESVSTMSVIIPAGSTSVSIDLDLIQDGTAEPDEVFSVIISTTTSSVSIPDNEGTVTILDDDQAILSINDVTVNEADGTASLTLTLDQPLDTDYEVTYSTSDATAIAGSDYEAVPSTTITIPAGSTSVTIDFDILDDAAVELTEVFNVFIFGGSNVSIPDNLGTVTILDNDTTAGEVCVVRDVSSVVKCSDVTTGINYGAWLRLDDEDFFYQFENGQLTEYTDGTATLAGEWVNNTNPNLSFNANITLTGRTSIAPVGSPKEHNCLGPNPASWYYYSAFSGSLIGTGDLVGAEIAINQFGPAFQVGMGANITDASLTFGASAWFEGSIVSQSNAGPTLTLDTDADGKIGDINIVLTGGIEACGYCNDSDGDGTCDGDDLCPGSDDNADDDYDGIPNGCDDNATNVCIERAATNVVKCGFYAGNVYGGYLLIQGEYNFYSLENGVFTEYSDGTANFTGLWNNLTNTQLSFDVNVNFSGRTIVTPAASPLPHICANPDESDFYYYESFGGTLNGLGQAAGAVIIIEDFGPAFQVGVGASNVELEQLFGASGWFNGYVAQQPTNGTIIAAPDEDGKLGDININLSGPFNGGAADFGDSDGDGIPNICDQPSISINDVTVNESEGTASLTISLSSPSSDDVTVSYTTINGSAIGGLDYTTTSQTVTIPAGSTSVTVDFDIIVDSNSEPTESFAVLLTNPTNAVISDDEGTVTIFDPVNPVLSINDVTVNEEDGTATLTLTLDQALDTDYVVTYSTSNGSAISGSDYEAVPTATITIPAGSTSVTIDFDILDDSTNEPTELFNVNISGPAGVSIPDDLGTVTILDNDPATIPVLSIDDVTVNEEDVTATLTLTLDEPLDTDYEVTYSTSDASAIAGSDYESVPSTTITIPAGSTSVTIDFDIVDDTTNEPTELFNVFIFGGSNVSIPDNLGTVTILDNDTTAGEVCVVRDVSSVVKCSDVTTGINYGAWLRLDDEDFFYQFENGQLTEYTDGTATLTGDWVNNTNSNLSFNADITLTGRTSTAPVGSPKEHNCLGPNDASWYYYTAFSGSLIGTGDLAGAELAISQFGPAFQVGMGANVTDASLTFGASAWFGGSIVSQPNAGPTLTLDPDVDGKIGDINVVLTGGIEACDYCNDSDGDGTCDGDDLCPGSDDNADDDYDGIPNGCDDNATNVCIERAATNVVKCGFYAGNVYGGYLLVQGEYNFYSLENGVFTEYSDGTANFTGLWNNLTNTQLSFDVNVNFSGRTIVTPAGSPLPHICANPDESDFYYYESFGGTLNGLGQAAGAVIIIEDFGPAFQVGVGASNVEQEQLFGASGWFNGYVAQQPTNGTIIAAPDEDGKLGDININLSGPFNGGSADFGDIDGDGIPNICDMPGLVIDDVVVYEEDGTATLTITLLAPGSDDVTVSYTTINGSAIAGNDYTAVSETVTIPAGTTSVTVPINILDDSIEEPTEDLTVLLSNVVNATIIDSEGTVTILDSDEDLPLLFISDVIVNEEDGTATLVVSISEAFPEAITVDFETNDNNAIAGVDYAATSGTVTIPAGSTSVNLTFDILDDNNPEDTELFNVLLTNSINAMISDDFGTVTILDGDSNTCDNVTDSGVIGYTGGTICTGEDPGTIESYSLPSGGSGDAEYIWLVSTNGCPTDGSYAVPNTNTATYNPGPLSESTWFIRCSRRNGCIEYPGESNCVYIEVDPCGSGGPENYCNAKGTSPWHEWISNVTFGDINNDSAKDRYGDFTDQSTTIGKGGDYTISLTNTWSYTTYNEYFNVYIDYNQDGEFQVPAELAFSGILAKLPNGTPTGTLNGLISVPMDANTGSTRMRITMQRNTYAGPCDVFAYGEVEDYTVNISNGGWSLIQTPVFSFNAEKEGRAVSINWATNSEYKNEYFVVEHSIDGQQFSEFKTQNSLNSHFATVQYDVLDQDPNLGDNYYRLKRVYQDGTFEYSPIRKIVFDLDVNSFTIFPNPTASDLYVNLKEYEGRTAVIEVNNSFGKIVQRIELDQIIADPVRFDLKGIAPGVYTLTVRVDNLRQMTKLFVITKM